MPINVPDNVQILGPSGFSISPNHVLTGANGTDVNTGAVYSSVPNQIVLGQRVGTWVVSHHGTRGTLKANVTVGATGSALMLGVLSVSRSNLDFSVQITLDDENRPECRIQSNGSTVAEWEAAGSTIANGTPIEVLLKWDASTPAFNGLHADFTINGNVPGGAWGTNPESSWITQPMSNFQIGWASATWADFNGSIQVIQLGEKY